MLCVVVDKLYLDFHSVSLTTEIPTSVKATLEEVSCKTLSVLNSSLNLLGLLSKI